MASISPFRIIEPEKNTASPGLRVAGEDSPVNADWSTCTGSPANKRASAGTMSPDADESHLRAPVHWPSVWPTSHRAWPAPLLSKMIQTISCFRVKLYLGGGAPNREPGGQPRLELMGTPEEYKMKTESNVEPIGTGQEGAGSPAGAGVEVNIKKVPVDKLDRLADRAARKGIDRQHRGDATIFTK